MSSNRRALGDLTQVRIWFHNIISTPRSFPRYFYTYNLASWQPRCCPSSGLFFHELPTHLPSFSHTFNLRFKNVRLVSHLPDATAHADGLQKPTNQLKRTVSGNTSTLKRARTASNAISAPAPSTDADSSTTPVKSSKNCTLCFTIVFQTFFYAPFSCCFYPRSAPARRLSAFSPRSRFSLVDHHSRLKSQSSLTPTIS